MGTKGRQWREILTGGDALKRSDGFPKRNANDLEIAFHSVYVSNVNKIFKCIPSKIFKKKKMEASQ